MTPRNLGLIFGAVAVIATLAAVATAFVISELFDDEGDDDDSGAWKTYHNDFYEYEVDYPADWQIVVKERTVSQSGTFETQGVTISKGPEGDGGPRVLAYVNFQSDWCLRGRRDELEIDVSGVEGIETSCYDCEASAPVEACPSEPHTIVRYFSGVKGRDNYAVRGDTRGDAETVRRIVESFRFTD